MRKMFSFVLIFVIISFLHTGCYEKKNIQSDLGLTQSEKKITLTYWVPNYSKSKDITTYNDMLIYNELEKRTGIHIDFRHPARGSEKVEFDMFVASSNLPDIIEWNWLLQYKGGPSKAIEDNKIIVLDEYIDKFAPNLKKILINEKDIKKSISTYDGKAYVFPYLNIDPITKIYNGPIIRMDWLEVLGLSKPKTVDEWYITLEAIKHGDPNQNGSQDEIPLAFGQMWRFVESNAFAGTWGVAYNFYLEDGKVKYGPIQPEYKQMLQTLNKWYNEGLIDPVFDNNIVNKIHLVGAFFGDKFDIVKYETSGKQRDSKMKLNGVEFPKLRIDDKAPYASIDYTYTGNSSSAITTSNKHVMETVKWLDYAYSEEGHKLFNFGIENVTYKMEGSKPIYTSLVTKDRDNSVDYTMSKYFRGSTGGPFVLAKEFIEQYANLVAPEVSSALHEWQKISYEHVVPFTPISPEQTNELNDITNNIMTYQLDMFRKFITGAVSLDKFDEYVAEMKKMGIDRQTEIIQR